MHVQERESSRTRAMHQSAADLTPTCFLQVCFLSPIRSKNTQDPPSRARARAPSLAFTLCQGASGAGKSTFLDLLAGKKSDGECAGQIRLKRASPAVDSSGSGSGGGRGCFPGGGGGGSGGRASVYVTQDDFHVAELTVRESLGFAVRLAMGGRGVRWVVVGASVCFKG